MWFQDVPKSSWGGEWDISERVDTDLIRLGWLADSYRGSCSSSNFALRMPVSDAAKGRSHNSMAANRMLETTLENL